MLGTTSGGGDGLLLQEEVHQHLGNPAGGVADVHYGAVAEEEVHGQLEAGVQPDQDEDEPVTQQGQQIGGPEQDSPAWVCRSPERPSRTNSPRSGCSSPWSRRARLPREERRQGRASKGLSLGVWD